MTTFRSYQRFMTGVSLLGLLVAVGCNRRPQASSDAWPKPSPTSTVTRNPTPIPNPKINRKTFSMTRPSGWTEDTTFEAHDPDTFVVFERGSKSNCLFEVITGKKSSGSSADILLASQKDGWLKHVTDPKVEQFDQWGSYRGQGYDIEGKLSGKYQRHRIFVFTKGDRVCLIAESAPPADFLYYAADFKTIRESFKLK